MAASGIGCCVPKCGRTRKDDTVLHSFPNPDNDMDRYRAWIQAIGLDATLEPQYVYHNRRVCHIHFETYFLTWTRRLSPDAIPTLLVPGSEMARPPLTNITNRIDDIVIHDDPLPSTSSARNLLSIESENILENDLSDATTQATSEYDDTEPVQFSWQNAQKISLDEDEDIVLGDEPAPEETEGKATKDDEDDRNLIKIDKHSEYFCDSCSKEIIGFRYTCVQCDNYDLCCECESNLKHPLHFMLRVPGQKPFSEVNSIIEAVREKIKILNEEAQKNSADLEFEEIKLEEPEFEEVTADPFSEVTPVHDLTSEPQAHTIELNSEKSPTSDIKKSDVYMTYTNRKKLKALNVYRPGEIANILKEGTHTLALPTNYIPTSGLPMNPTEACVHLTNSNSAQPLNFTHPSIHSTNANHTSVHPMNPNHTSGRPSSFTHTIEQPSNFTYSNVYPTNLTQTSVHSMKNTHSSVQPTLSTHTSGRPNSTHTSVQPCNFSDTSAQPSNFTRISVKPSIFTYRTGQPYTFTNTSVQLSNFTDTSVQPTNFTDTSVQPSNITHTSVPRSNFTQTSVQPSKFTHRSGLTSKFTNTSEQPSDSTHTNVNPTYSTHTSEPHTRETLTKDTAPTVSSQNSIDPKLLLDCYVLLTPLTGLTTQAQTVPATFTYNNKQPITKNVDEERKESSHRRKQDLKRKTYEDLPSEQIRHAVSKPVLEKETADEQISCEVIELDSEAQEYLGEIWLEDEMENVKQTSTQDDAPIEEIVEEMWLDETLLSVESQHSS